MAKTNVADKVRKILGEHLSVDLAEVTDDAKLGEDLGADSLDFVEVVMACEEEWEIQIPDDDTEGLVTVQHVIAYVEKAVAARAKG